ncbi:MAG TPA: hypothetical protein VFJ58_01130 [Armatimonadota bacterium]|nr:hypothetical protein [Armatimonadota bacterium]
MSERSVLDACCVQNLYATGAMPGILGALPYAFVIGTRCRGEAPWLKMEKPGEREAVDLAPLLHAGLLEEQSLDGSLEMALFVELSRQMEDGEAEAAALAINRGYCLATDERKVRRILASSHRAPQIRTTSELLHEWQIRSGLSDEVCGAALKRVTFRASFSPPHSDKHRDWWLKLTQT